MRVRSRLCRFVEVALHAWGIERPLSDMPEGNADWEDGGQEDTEGGGEEK